MEYIMARKRMIDPSLWTDEGFLELSDKAKLLYIGLISFADDEGRGRGSAKGLKANIFPSNDIKCDEIEKLKDEIETNLNVLFYEVKGKKYYTLHKWKEYQAINHPKPSCIPIPVTVRDSSRNDTVSIQDDSPQLINKLINKKKQSNESTGKNDDFVVLENEYFKLFKDKYGAEPDYKYSRDRGVLKKYLEKDGVDKLLEILRVWFAEDIGEWHGFSIPKLQNDYNKIIAAMGKKKNAKKRWGDF